MVCHVEIGQSVGNMNSSVSKLSSFLGSWPLKSHLARPLLGHFSCKLSSFWLFGHLVISGPVSRLVV